jgi:hypothetical protein
VLWVAALGLFVHSHFALVSALLSCGSPKALRAFCLIQSMESCLLVLNVEGAPTCILMCS